MNLVSVLQSETRLVDVAGIEPATPCLQNQKTNLDTVKKNENE